MTIHRHAARRDSNEKRIVQHLTAVGASVQKLSGKGVGDLLVGFRGSNFLLEVKARKGKLTPDQLTFIESWQGQYCVARTPEEATDAIGATS